MWARLAFLFGDQAVSAIVVEGARRDADEAAVQEETARLEAEERRRLHERIELFILDPKNQRPGLSLESGDEDKPFFVMRFSEKWERERVLDWMRWQSRRFVRRTGRPRPRAPSCRTLRCEALPDTSRPTEAGCCLWSSKSCPSMICWPSSPRSVCSQPLPRRTTPP
ncbi:MAG: hypothetical protein FJ335_12325 [Sphingomonadales bacterium]|nr:hypothetical protein [Sphingomonadales bacterium]